MTDRIRLEGERQNRADKLGDEAYETLTPAFEALHQAVLETVVELMSSNGEEITHAAVDSAVKSHFARLLITAYDGDALHAHAHIGAITAELLSGNEEVGHQ